jgi:UDP-glucose 4-epimerase
LKKVAINYSKLSGKNVLITGGLGFIGSSIAHRCVRLGANVTLLDACLEPYGWNYANIVGIGEIVEIVEGDVRDFRLMEKLVSGKEIVFHMAGQVGREISMEDPILDMEINCSGTINLLEACRKGADRPKVIFAGSRGQIGEPVYMPVDEEHPETPTDVYGINKMAAERYLFLYGSLYEFPVVSLRLNNIYGPRCQMHAGFYGILNWFMSNAMTGKPITIYGEGRQTRDYLYISDAVDAFIRAALLEAADHEVFMVGSGVETVFIEMVNEVVSATGKGAITHVKFPGNRQQIDIKKFVADVGKAERLLGWKPQVDLKTGIRQTYDFYKEDGILEKYLRRRSG